LSRQMASDARYSCDAGGTKRKKPGRNIRRLPNASHTSVRGIRCIPPRMFGYTGSDDVNPRVRCCKPQQLDAARNSEDFESFGACQDRDGSDRIGPTLCAAGQSAESRGHRADTPAMQGSSSCQCRTKRMCSACLALLNHTRGTVAAGVAQATRSARTFQLLTASHLAGRPENRGEAAFS
jgi:hypothetical protein